MAKWTERLKVFLGENPKPEPSITLNRETPIQLKVIEGAILGESAKKILEGAGSTGPNTEPLKEGFLEEKAQTGTVNNRQLQRSTVTKLEPEPIEAEPEDGYEILPAESPWLELSDNAQGIWDALETRGTRTLHLIDQDGRKACHSFTASKPSDLKELARRGLKTFPRIKRLTVIAVMPETAIVTLEPRTVN